MKSKYKTYAEWREAEPNAYQKACFYGLLDVICEKFGWVRNPNNRKPAGYWTKERCIEEAKKYNTVKEWKLNSLTTYEKAKWLRFLDECTTHMVEKPSEPRKQAGYWDRKNCKLEAKKYNTTFEWYKKSPHTVRVAIKNNWFKACTTHMFDKRTPIKSKYSKKYCLDSASNYSSAESWKKNYSLTYYTAVKHGWVKSICKKLWNQNITL